MAKTFINKWEELLKMIESSNAPFAYWFSIQSKKFDNLDE